MTDVHLNDGTIQAVTPDQEAALVWTDHLRELCFEGDLDSASVTVGKTTVFVTKTAARATVPGLGLCDIAMPSRLPRERSEQVTDLLPEEQR